MGQGVQQETGGIIGAIHNIGSSDNSLVSVDSNGQGVKGAKFCAFQDAMHEMSTVPPIAMITKTGVADSVNCTACTSVDINDGSCGPPTGSAPGSLPLCDDGAPCTLPPGLDASDAKCPANTIVAQCMPCSSMTTTTFNCTETYSNWTKENIDGPVSELTDSYSDVLAGLPAPYKCCINDSSDNNYTYTEQEYSGSEDTPVVFSGS